MSPTARHGQIALLLFILALIAISGLIVYMSLSIGARPPMRTVVRLGLELALCTWLYFGSRIAKWVMIVLLGLGCALGVTFALLVGNIAALPVLAIAALYAAFAAALLTSHQINAFLAHQRIRKTDAA